MADGGGDERGSLQQELIDRYQRLLDRLNEMLAHARAGRWAEIIAHESEYLAELEHLRYLEADAELSEAMQFHRARLGREILEKNAEVKRYLIERRDALGALIEQAERQAEGLAEEPEDFDETALNYDPEQAKS